MILSNAAKVPPIIKASIFWQSRGVFLLLRIKEMHVFLQRETMGRKVFGGVRDLLASFRKTRIAPTLLEVRWCSRGYSALLLAFLVDHAPF
jgi:hypothetical protein